MAKYIVRPSGLSGVVSPIRDGRKIERDESRYVSGSASSKLRADSGLRKVLEAWLPSKAHEEHNEMPHSHIRSMRLRESKAPRGISVYIPV